MHIDRNTKEYEKVNLLFLALARLFIIFPLQFVSHYYCYNVVCVVEENYFCSENETWQMKIDLAKNAIILVDKNPYFSLADCYLKAHGMQLYSRNGIYDSDSLHLSGICHWCLFSYLIVHSFVQ